MTTIEKIQGIIKQVESDIAMHSRLLAEATSDEGRAYQERQIEVCRKQLAKRSAMLTAEVAKTN